MKLLIISIISIFLCWQNVYSQNISLVSPLNNIVIDTNSINFNWNKEANILYYVIQISNDSSFNSVLLTDSTGLTEKTFSSFTSCEKYFWRVRGKKITQYSNWSNFNTFILFNPKCIPQLSLWLSADTGIVETLGKVSEWHDLSGNNNDAVQLVSANAPFYYPSDDSINGMPTVFFDGLNSFLNGTIINNIDISSNTILTVCSGEPEPLNANAGIFCINNFGSGFWFERWTNGTSSLLYSTNGNYFYTSPSTLNELGFNYKVLGSEKLINSFVKLFINNTLAGQSTSPQISSTFTNANYNIGYAPGFQYYHGNIPEIIVYNQLLNDSLFNLANKYLFDKYAPPVNLGFDIDVTSSLCDTIIHAGNRFVSYLWSTGETTESISVNTSGTYTITVTNIFGIQSSDSIYIKYPSVELNDTMFCSNSSVQISSNLGSGFTYLWSTGETTSSININTPNSYWVSVTTGSCSKVSNTIQVTEDSFPIIASLGNDTNLCSSNLIGLVAPAPLPSGLSYYWSTGETIPNIAVNSISDFYYITVTNSNGCVAKDTIWVNILGTAPVIDFANSASCSNETIQFTNLSTPVGSSWNWNFGDSQTSSSQNPAHLYTSGGVYNVTLEVSVGSCSNSRTKQITIPEAPTSAFNISTACVGNEFSFFDQSTVPMGDTIISWDWNFGDSTPHSTSKNSQHIYLSSGSYSVALIIQTQKSCSDTVIHVINVVSNSIHPSYFELCSPTNGLILSDQSIDFIWNNSNNASLYTLQYSTDNTFLNNVSTFSNIQFNNFHTILSSVGQYYWRVIAYNICNDSVISSINSFNYFLPNNLQDNVIWLSADSVELNSNTVHTWYDKSGNNYNSTQVISDQQPLFVNNDSLLNNHPIIRFDGNNDLFNGTLINGINDTSLSIFIVAKGYSQGGNEAGFFNISNWTNGFWFNRRISDQNLSLYNNGDYFWTTPLSLPSTGFPFKILEGVKIINIKTQLYINEILSNESTVPLLNSAFINDNYIIGYSQGFSYLNGEIAEIILYNRALPNNERKQVEKYIHDKYAPPVNLGPDIQSTNFCPVTIDAINRYVKYNWSTTNLISGDTLSKITVTKPGQYSVTVTDVFGATSVDTIKIFMPFNGFSDTTICFNSLATFNSNLSHLFTFNWSDLTTDSLITVSDSGNYWVQITDSLGCSNIDSFFVNIDFFPLTATLGPDTISVCSGNSISLQSGANQTTNYLWNDNSTNSNLIVNSTGNYWVLVTNNRGCTATDTVYVNIQGTAPLPGFYYTNTCLNDQTIFTDTSQTLDGSNINAWQWIINNDTTITQNTSNIFNGIGNYQVILTVTTDSNCSNTISKNITIHPNPLADYSVSGTCMGGTSYFTNLSLISQGSLSNMNWSFGDSNYSILLNPQHTFSDIGFYQVQLIATSNEGCTDTITKNIEIKYAPTANFDFSPACTGSATWFFDLTETLNIFPIIKWNWDFGDASTSLQQNPQHIYSAVGQYPVSLIIKSLNGCEDTITNLISVSAPPVAGFVGDSTCFGLPLQFTDTSSVLNDSIYKWQWDFGNNTHSNQQNNLVNYSDTGNYIVNLTVTSTVDCIDQVSKIIKVFPLPVPGFLSLPDLGAPPLLVNFTNNSNDLSYWSFGDGQTSQINSPVHVFNDTGNYIVWLKSENSHGCIDSTSRSIKVVPNIFDLAILSVDYTNNSGYLTIHTIIANVGTMPIIKPILTLSSDKNTPIVEIYQDTIFSGEILDYYFTSLLPYNETFPQKYVCVKGSLSQSIIDKDLTNNEACKTIVLSNVILNLYPNPSSTEINLDLNITIPGDSKLDIFDKEGRMVYSNHAQLSIGFNRLTISVMDFAKGKYTLTLKTPEGENTTEFIKY
ncbi:MAG: PKD domain-containing protein [Bacteroidia bacterium]|nr:PKD domain-containing protein [Bacteroidia bacterium]